MRETQNVSENAGLCRRHDIRLPVEKHRLFNVDISFGGAS
ncbi:MAG: hypothetical protein QOK37_11 [Thermoanaerobaculia bacterium]|nr:hypothetical protein [Thermoanaerobaculia bacterium]